MSEKVILFRFENPTAPIYWQVVEEIGLDTLLYISFLTVFDNAHSEIADIVAEHDNPDITIQDVEEAARKFIRLGNLSFINDRLKRDFSSVSTVCSTGETEAMAVLRGYT